MVLSKGASTRNRKERAILQQNVLSNFLRKCDESILHVNEMEVEKEADCE
jgi:hypothetical protein